METIQRADGWWVTGLLDCDDCGPYQTKALADDDMRGLSRFYKWKDEPGFITCCDSPKREAKQANN